MAKRVSVRDFKDNEEERLLRTLRKSKDVIAVKRAEIIISSAQGDSAPEIADRLYFTSDYVRKVIHAFNKEGMRAIFSKYRNGGRPRTILPEHESELVELSMMPPDIIGLPFTHWSLETLRDEAVKRKLVPEISIESVRQILKSHRRSLQRTKTWKKSDDPEFDEKKTPSKDCIKRQKRGRKK
jgi:transposase